MVGSTAHTSSPAVPQNYVLKCRSLANRALIVGLSALFTILYITLRRTFSTIKAVPHSSDSIQAITMCMNQED